MIRRPTSLTKIRLHRRSVSAAPKPKAPDTTPHLYNWPGPPQGLNKWSRPVAHPSSSIPSEISAHNSESQPSIVPSAVRAAPPQGLNKWSRPVAPPNSKLSELSTLNPDFQQSVAQLAAQKVSQPNSSPTLLDSAIAVPPQKLNKWSRPVAPPSNDKLSEGSVLNSGSQPSIAPLAAQKVSQPRNKPTSLSPNSEHANSSSTLAETFSEQSRRAIYAVPSPETLNKWTRPVSLPPNSKPSETPTHNPGFQPSIAPLAAQKVSRPENNLTSSPDSSSSPTSLEDPRIAIGAVPPQRLNKRSGPVAPPSTSRPSVHNSESQPSTVPPTVRAAPPQGLDKWARPVTLPSTSKPSEISVHNSESQPSIIPPAVRAAPPQGLNKWARPVAPPSNSKPSEVPTLNPDSQPSVAPLAAQKVSQPKNKPTFSSPDSDHANTSPTLLEDPHTAIGAVPPQRLNKWSRPAAPPFNDKLSKVSVLNSDSQPSIAPLAAQKASQPQNKPASLSPNSEHVNSSPTLAKTPAEQPSRSLRAAPSAETLSKWARPVTPPSDSIASQISALNSNARPSMPPLTTQKDRDSDYANSSSTLAESPRIATSAAPREILKKSRPVVPPSNTELSDISIFNSDSQLSKVPRTAQRVLKPNNNVSQRSSLIPDSKHAKKSLEETRQPQTPPSLEFRPSLDTDTNDEFADKRLRSDSYRRNQKSYFEGRGRFERVPSKLLMLQSANNPLAKKKKESTVPKLIKANRMDVFIPSTISVAALATLLNVKLARLQRQMKRAGMESESSYDHVLTSDYAVLLAEEFGFNPVVDDEAAFDIHPPAAHSNPSSLPSRPPIVTIMGHVDHGKTTLLDTLRSASVAKGEAGGITQHIGAFSVPVNEKGSGPKSITFLDTPGHAAFSAMRARGANVTDIIVLVVAADDGIMPQTKEVINLFKRDDSQVSLVVAINKIDKPNVDLDSVKGALMTEGIQVEDFGGDIPAVNVSGLTGEGLPELLETLSVVSEMQDLRAEQTGSVYGHVLESNVQKGLGPVATILILRGCLKAGMHVLSGLSHAKVRRMNDSNGKVVKEAIPGMAVTVSGWKILPKAGDIVLDGSENDIKKAISNRARRQELEALHQDVDAINSRRQQHRDLRSSGEEEAPPEPVPSGPLELKLIIKADVSGSAEAVKDALHGMGNTIARAQVISTGVGDILESDVMMAKAANATIVGFSVTPSRSVKNIATQNGIPICTSDIIYRLVDDVRERVTALLPVVVETKVTGEATILQVFDIDLKQRQTMRIAGCRVTNGLLEKQKFARVLRNGDIIFDGTLSTMRHIKKDITEARKGTECGLGFGEFRDLEAGDLIQMYEKIEKPGIL